MASRNTPTVRAISPISSLRSVLATGASNSPALSEAIRCFSTASGFTTLRVIIQAIAIDSTISTAMTIDAVRTIDQNDASTDEMNCAFPIIRCQGPKPRDQATLSIGVGSALLRRTLLTARNRGYRLLHMACLADNRRMQQLARKFDAELSFDFGSVVGEVKSSRANPLSLMKELMADSHGFATAMLDLQTRMLRA